MARGGDQKPKQPAPVSGPGALSQRTDGGAGSKSQPIRVPGGEGYGERKASIEQQQAAPLANTAQTPPPSPVPTPRVPAGAPQPGVGGAFGPTERPHESPLAGMNPRGMAIAEDVDGFLRVLYSQFPHPAIGALLRKDM